MPRIEEPFTALIVDDLKTIRFIIQQLLTKRMNMHVIEAVDGQDALLKIAQYDPDLLFVDISMPVMDGIELVTRLRNDARFEHLPIIVLTAIEDRQTIKKMASLNIMDYMLKPFEGHTATHRIKKLLSANAHLFKKKLPFEPISI